MGDKLRLITRQSGWGIRANPNTPTAPLKGGCVGVWYWVLPTPIEGPTATPIPNSLHWGRKQLGTVQTVENGAGGAAPEI